MEVRRTLRSLMADLGRPLDDAWPGDCPLDLASIDVVMLHDALEQAFEVRIPAARVTPDAFATLESLEGLLREVRA